MYRPEKEIIRQEMFTLMYNILKQINKLPEATTDVPPAHFVDVEKIAGWAREPMTLFVRAGIITGSDGYINPEGVATRVQLAQIIYKLLKRQ